jgi:hypothetical protein
MCVKGACVAEGLLGALKRLAPLPPSFSISSGGHVGSATTLRSHTNLLVFHTSILILLSSQPVAGGGNPIVSSHRTLNVPPPSDLPVVPTFFSRTVRPSESLAAALFLELRPQLEEKDEQDANPHAAARTILL